MLTATSNQTPLKVALVIPTLVRGGAEKQLCLLAAGLRAEGMEPHVVVLTHDGTLHDELDAQGVPVTVIGKRFRGDLSAYFKLRQWLKRWNGDVVHTWLFAANAFGRAAALSAGIPVILGSERCVDPWKAPWQFWIDRYLAKRTTGLTTNSLGVQQFYDQHGVGQSRFTVIPNGIPPVTAMTIERREAFQQLKVPEHHKLVVSVGRLWPQKRYRDLIWSAELLATLRQDITYVIIGDGPQAAELLRFRDSVSKTEHVRFAGHRDNVAQLLPHADLFWNGSEYEGQSNSILEAMQAGVCVIASDIPGNRDLVQDAHTGRLVKLGDKADFARLSQQLLEDPVLRSRYAAQAKAKVETEFTVQQMVRQHAELYRRLWAAQQGQPAPTPAK